MDKSRLKDLLIKPEYSRRDKILLCLATDNYQPKQIRDIKSLAVGSGLRPAGRWNLSQILKDSGALVRRVDEGWELSSDGRRLIAEIAGPSASAAVPAVASSLRQYLPTISDTNTKEFLEEAIECFEQDHYRASVVLSWVGAVSALQHHVIKHRLADFNSEALARHSDWKPAKTPDDLSLMKESEFLIILERLSIIGKNVKKELGNCLDLRNACGHPNSLKLGTARVSAHLEILILNVFAVF